MADDLAKDLKKYTLTPEFLQARRNLMLISFFIIACSLLVKSISPSVLGLKVETIFSPNITTAGISLFLLAYFYWRAYQKTIMRSGSPTPDTEQKIISILLNNNMDKSDHSYHFRYIITYNNTEYKIMRKGYSKDDNQVKNNTPVKSGALKEYIDLCKKMKTAEIKDDAFWSDHHLPFKFAKIAFLAAILRISFEWWITTGAFPI